MQPRFILLALNKWLPRKPVRWNYVVVRDCHTAQAVELVRALRQQLHEMTTRLAEVERNGVTCTSGRACEMRLEGAALRRDIAEAKFHIERLQRYYLGLNGSGQPRVLVADVLGPAALNGHAAP
jgi:hypothetical protein